MWIGCTVHSAYHGEIFCFDVRTKHDIQRSFQCLQVFYHIFSSHNNISTVPDRLLCGLIRNTLYYYFVCTSTDEDLRKIEITILCSIAESGLPQPRSIVKWSKRVNFQCLYCMIIASLFGILLVGCKIFVQHEHDERDPIFSCFCRRW